ncbi:Tn3 family transposase, partial [Escherichia coli]|uniref:Tn3 family transposase n=1 Tax=Escherichia coli TaxID=562 RepID=UPI003D9A33D3
LYKQIPPTRITDLLLEVDAATGFTEAFTHLRTGAPCADRIGLMNVILAEGINLGLRKMADATNTHTFWELIRIGRWHVEGEAYDAQNGGCDKHPHLLGIDPHWTVACRGRSL